MCRRVYTQLLKCTPLIAVNIVAAMQHVSDRWVIGTIGASLPNFACQKLYSRLRSEIRWKNQIPTKTHSYGSAIWVDGIPSRMISAAPCTTGTSASSTASFCSPDSFSSLIWKPSCTRHSLKPFCGPYRPVWYITKNIALQITPLLTMPCLLMWWWTEPGLLEISFRAPESASSMRCAEDVPGVRGDDVFGGRGI